MVNPDQKFNIEDVMSFVVLGNWYLSNYGLVTSAQLVSGPKINYEINRDTIKVLLPHGVKSYDMRLDYDPKIFSGNLIAHTEEVSLINTDDERGLLNIISEHKNKDEILVSYALNDKQTLLDLYVQAYDLDGSIISNLYETIELEIIPENFYINQNYPNPFNPVTSIDYGLPKSSNVNLVIYDIMGREIITLVDEYQESGIKTIKWAGIDSFGRNVSAGLYFYKINSDNFQKVKKMILLK